MSTKLTYELTFNSYGKVIKSSDTNATFKLSNISLEYEIVRHAELARSIRQSYSNLNVYYERVHRHSVIPMNKKDVAWNVNLNTPAKSLKGILLLFQEPQVDFAPKPTKFYNPMIQKVSTTIEGLPNQLYAQGLQRRQHWEEASKYFQDVQNDSKLK